MNLHNFVGKLMIFPSLLFSYLFSYPYIKLLEVKNELNRNLDTNGVDGVLLLFRLDLVGAAHRADSLLPSVGLLSFLLVELVKEVGEFVDVDFILVAKASHQITQFVSGNVNSKDVKRGANVRLRDEAVTIFGYLGIEFLQYLYNFSFSKR